MIKLVGFLGCLCGTGAFLGPRPALRSAIPRQASFLSNVLKDGPVSEKKQELLSFIAELEGEGSSRGSQALSFADNQRLNNLIEDLASLNPTPEAVSSSRGRDKLAGVWRLVYTARANQGLEGKEWLQYLIENGPSPIQRFVLGSTQQVGKVYQLLELTEAGGRFNNFIDFREALGGVLNLQAEVTSFTGGTQLDIRFNNAYFAFDRNPVTGTTFGKQQRLPYPVPFRLLPNESRGLLDNIFVDNTLRLARGNKGTIFVLERDESAVFPALEYVE